MAILLLLTIHIFSFLPSLSFPMNWLLIFIWKCFSIFFWLIRSLWQEKNALSLCSFSRWHHIIITTADFWLFKRSTGDILMLASKKIACDCCILHVSLTYTVWTSAVYLSKFKRSPFVVSCCVRQRIFVVNNISSYNPGQNIMGQLWKLREKMHFVK